MGYYKIDHALLIVITQALTPIARPIISKTQAGTLQAYCEVVKVLGLKE